MKSYSTIKGAREMDVEKYSFIIFEHSQTDHLAEMKISNGVCNFYYVESEPRWHMQESVRTINERFEKGEYRFVEGVSKND